MSARLPLAASLAAISLFATTAPAAEPEKNRHRRRHHRVPARQRPARAALSRRLAADGHREHDRPRRLAARGLRRDRHGPPARAHGLQGHADASRRSQGAARPRGAASTARPASTAPTTSRRCRPPTTTWSSRIRFEADRLVNSFVQREDLLSEMTVVRNEFERGENSPGSAARASG